MKAKLAHRSKQVFPDGSIAEIVIWVLPKPVEGSRHRFKYRLYFGRDGIRIIGFDNERGKGDHCHLDCQEYPYVFTTPDALLDNFYAEIIKRMQLS